MSAFATKITDLQSTTAQLKERAAASATQAAQTGLTVLLVRDVLLAALTAALGLCLFGLHLLLAKWLGPAAAAIAVGLLTLISLGLGSCFGLTKLRRKIDAKLSGSP